MSSSVEIRLESATAGWIPHEPYQLYYVGINVEPPPIGRSKRGLMPHGFQPMTHNATVMVEVRNSPGAPPCGKNIASFYHATECYQVHCSGAEEEAEMKSPDPDNLVRLAHALFYVALVFALLWMLT